MSDYDDLFIISLAEIVFLYSVGLAVCAHFLDILVDLLTRLAVTGVGKFADILERVVRPYTAELFNCANHFSEAVVVLNIAIVGWDSAEDLEKTIDVATVVDFSLKLI